MISSSILRVMKDFGSKKGINGTLHSSKDKENQKVASQTRPDVCDSPFRVLNAAYLERRWSLLCALRISAPAHTISGPKQRMTVSPAFKPWQQKKF